MDRERISHHAMKAWPAKEALVALNLRSFMILEPLAYMIYTANMGKLKSNDSK